MPASLMNNLVALQSLYRFNPKPRCISTTLLPIHRMDAESKSWAFLFCGGFLSHALYSALLWTYVQHVQKALLVVHVMSLICLSHKWTKTCVWLICGRILGSFLWRLCDSTVPSPCGHCSWSRAELKPFETAGKAGQGVGGGGVTRSPCPHLMVLVVAMPLFGQNRAAIHHPISAPNPPMPCHHHLMISRYSYCCLALVACLHCHLAATVLQ